MFTAIRSARPARTRRDLLARLWSFARLHRQRTRLVALDDHILRDIGITRDDAVAEAQRRFWDVPGHWRG